MNYVVQGIWLYGVLLMDRLEFVDFFLYLFLFVLILFIGVSLLYFLFGIVDKITESQENKLLVLDDGVICTTERCMWSGCDLYDCSDGVIRRSATNYREVTQFGG